MPMKLRERGLEPRTHADKVLPEMVPHRFRLLGAAAAALLCLAPALAGETTPERLLNADGEPQNWLMNLGNYEGHRFSGLSLIDRETVGGLVVRFSVPLGGLMDASGNYRDALPVSPLVEDGYIYIVDGWGAVSKLDLRAKGEEVWRSDAGQHNLDAWLQASRGLALYGNFVLSISADGQLHWLDKGSGEITRSVQVGDPVEGYTISAPPLVVGDTIIVGGAGADRGARSRIDAFHAVTGARLWSRFPAPEGDAGGAFLQTGVYDRGNGLTLWGAAHPFPRYEAPEDEIGAFGNAVVALDAATGQIDWTHRLHDDAAGGYSEAGSYQLLPAGEGGPSLLLHFGNDGLFHALDAAGQGEKLASPYLPLGPNQAAAGGAEPAAWPAGWARRPGCPNIRSTPAFVSAYSPATGLSYGAGADWCIEGLHPIVSGNTPNWLGGYFSGVDNAMGMLTAIDPRTATIAAQRLFDFPLHSGALATAGGLVFTTTADGTLHALDDETLETLWSQKFATLASVPPISFGVDGEQFLAVVVGGNAFANQLSYRPPESGMSQNLFVLLVLGQRA